MKCLFCGKQFNPTGKQNCGCGMKYCSPLCRYKFWVKNNPKQVKVISHKSKLKHHQQRLEYGHRYYALHKEEIQKKLLAWRRKYPSLVVQQVINRKCKSNGNGGFHTFEEWQALKRKYNFRCAICGKKKKLTRDHIFPVSKGGDNYISNIQPLCGACNSRKFNHM